MRKTLIAAALALLPIQAAALTIIIPMPPTDFPPVTAPVTKDAAPR